MLYQIAFKDEQLAARLRSPAKRDVSKAAAGSPALFETRSALLRDAGDWYRFERTLDLMAPTGVEQHIQGHGWWRVLAAAHGLEPLQFMQGAVDAAVDH